MRQFYTYLHCKPNGEPFYVGKGFGKRSHIFTTGRNKHHQNIVAKHGKENIGVFVFHCDSEARARQTITPETREKLSIATRNRWANRKFDFNVHRPTAETKAKMSATHKERWKIKKQKGDEA